jgi:hypothetical protein
VLSGYEWSGDYPGFAQIALEKWYPGAIALFFQGAGADQNPLPRRLVSLARQYGVTLAAAVDCTLQEEMKRLPATIGVAYKEIDLPLDAPPSEETLSAIIQNQSGYQKNWALRMREQIKNGQVIQSYPYPVQAWNIGGWPLFALGGEVVVEYAIRLKQLYGQDAFVLGYSNDVMAYIPSVTILKEGGYEGADSQMVYGLPGLWKPEIEPLIGDGLKEVAEQAGIHLANEKK